MRQQWIIALACAAGIAAGDESPKPKPPNVIFILTDDQGWGDAGFAGHPYVKTPNLDRFATQSTWYRQFYVAATVCSPSRCAFMTSHAPAREHIHGHFATHAQNAQRGMPNFLDPRVPNLARLLKGAGYATGHFGKWHLGSGAGAPPPTEYGFDEAKCVNGNGPALGDEAKEPYFRAKSTALIVDEAIRFLKARRGQPFFLNLWTLLPHAKLDPTPEQLAEYAALALRAEDPAYGPWMRKYLEKAPNLPAQMQVFCASLTDLDTQLGRLFAALDEMKLADDTLVFLSSDNGPEDYRIGNARNGGVGSVGPLRGRKRSMHEGGIRTFGLLRWPGKVAAGKRDEETVLAAVDFLPSVCKLAGVPLPADAKLDGEDMSDVWLGAARPRRTPLHWEWLFNVQGREDGYFPPMLSARVGNWKVFCDHRGGAVQLYDIPRDPGEEHDRAAAQPELARTLAAQAVAWAKALPASPTRDRANAQGAPDAPKGKGKAKGKNAKPGE